MSISYHGEVYNEGDSWLMIETEDRLITIKAVYEGACIDLYLVEGQARELVRHLNAALGAQSPQE